jgi:hypothetical protein
MPGVDTARRYDAAADAARLEGKRGKVRTRLSLTVFFVGVVTACAGS